MFWLLRHPYSSMYLKHGDSGNVSLRDMIQSQQLGNVAAVTSFSRDAQELAPSRRPARLPPINEGAESSGDET
jgi:hypothetical protein